MDWLLLVLVLEPCHAMSSLFDRQLTTSDAANLHPTIDAGKQRWKRCCQEFFFFDLPFLLRYHPTWEAMVCSSPLTTRCI
jgi:hypothetical protein